MGQLRLTAEQPRQGHLFARSPDQRASEHGGRSINQGILYAVVAAAGSALLLGIPRPIHLTTASGRAAIETLIATSALVSAGFLLVSFRQSRRRSDLLLLTALAALGLTDFVFSALPALLDSPSFSPGTAPEMACGVLAAVAFVAAAFTPPGRMSGSGLGPVRAAIAMAAATIACTTVIGLIAGEPSLAAASPGTGIGAAAAHPVLLAEAVFSSAAMFVAGTGFFARAERDALTLAGASFLLAAARLQYLALPAVGPDWVSARDGFRLLAYGLLLATALGRHAQARRAIAAASLAVERERIARDLHDGLAQDLAYIALQGQRLSSELGTDHPLTMAARRAVAASRGVIVDLSASDADSADAALRQVADELAARFGIEVDLRIADGSDGKATDGLTVARREEVVRIAREAIVNAARHGGAHHVALALDHTGPQWRLRVSDDGLGMAAGTPLRRGGYGLQMMRARAAALGGRLLVHPSPQGGTEVEVTFPFDGASRR
ncbi:MAG TPA: ATP-binding protein [Solirubrobacteraceae bacterium]|nr:ATP-binding protein [Solirubrobacteraceae bacterium]